MPPKKTTNSVTTAARKKRKTRVWSADGTIDRSKRIVSSGEVDASNIIEATLRTRDPSVHYENSVAPQPRRFKRKSAAASDGEKSTKSRRRTSKAKKAADNEDKKDKKKQKGDEEEKPKKRGRPSKADKEKSAAAKETSSDKDENDVEEETIEAEAPASKKSKKESSKKKPETPAKKQPEAAATTPTSVSKATPPAAKSTPKNNNNATTPSKTATTPKTSTPKATTPKANSTPKASTPKSNGTPNDSTNGTKNVKRRSGGRTSASSALQAQLNIEQHQALQQAYDTNTFAMSPDVKSAIEKLGGILVLGQPNRTYRNQGFNLPVGVQQLLDVQWPADIAFKSSKYDMNQMIFYEFEVSEWNEITWLKNNIDAALIGYGDKLLAVKQFDCRDESDYSVYIIDDQVNDGTVIGPVKLSQFLNSLSVDPRGKAE